MNDTGRTIVATVAAVAAITAVAVACDTDAACAATAPRGSPPTAHRPADTDTGAAAHEHPDRHHRARRPPRRR
jgi:hypothetical protein